MLVEIKISKGIPLLPEKYFSPSPSQCLTNSITFFQLFCLEKFILQNVFNFELIV